MLYTLALYTDAFIYRCFIHLHYMLTLYRCYFYIRILYPCTIATNTYTHILCTAIPGLLRAMRGCCKIGMICINSHNLAAARRSCSVSACLPDRPRPPQRKRYPPPTPPAAPSKLGKVSNFQILQTTPAS